eukprot:CAMPEP_0119121480 /NCGR_PEP_ID=MMETSP1310-20130426/2092_1 /TAXON_ID=464262 /ORGANISM="Genus nov. species nov., Strain RCC2339" /LENGTH=300 /DNA_ID=CAMNT_0007111047 /DNA_START=131 /DNA_END=1030 /DNA_ORIENTATION=+
MKYEKLLLFALLSFTWILQGTGSRFSSLLSRPRTQVSPLMTSSSETSDFKVKFDFSSAGTTKNPLKLAFITAAYPSHKNWFISKLKRLRYISHRTHAELQTTWIFAIDHKSGSSKLKNAVYAILEEEKVQVAEVTHNTTLAALLSVQTSRFAVIIIVQEVKLGDRILNWLHEELPDDMYMTHVDYDNTLPCSYADSFIEMHETYPGFAGVLFPIVRSNDTLFPKLRPGHLDTASFIARSDVMKQSKAYYCLKPKKFQKHKCPYRFPDANMIIQYFLFIFRNQLTAISVSTPLGFHNAEKW